MCRQTPNKTFPSGIKPWDQNKRLDSGGYLINALSLIKSGGAFRSAVAIAAHALEAGEVKAINLRLLDPKSGYGHDVEPFPFTPDTVAQVKKELRTKLKEMRAGL